MRIKEIILREGFYFKKIEFSPYTTLVHSKKNTVGKTTLIRSILFCLGYDIPSTKGIRFERCTVKLILQKDNNQVYTLERYGNKIIYKCEEEEKNYFLPNEKNDLQAIIFNSTNLDILENLLGAFYFDQEKGTSTYNYGEVINKNRFDIKAFIRGLGDCDCSSLTEKINANQKSLANYKSLKKIIILRDEFVGDSENFLEQQEEIEDLDLLEFRRQLKIKKEELRKIKKTIESNDRFIKYVEELKLVIETSEHELISVTKENLTGFKDNKSLLINKQFIVQKEIQNLERQIFYIENENNGSLVRASTILQMTGDSLSKLNFSLREVESEISRIKNEIVLLKDEIEQKTKETSNIIGPLFTTIKKYLIEFGVFEENDHDLQYSSFIFRHNFGNYSGAKLYKLSIAFKLAYILEYKRKANIKLPIIFDSPRDKEVDSECIELVMSVIQRDFSDYQIILASIYDDYKFETLKIVEVQDQLIDERE